MSKDSERVKRVLISVISLCDQARGNDARLTGSEMKPERPTDEGEKVWTWGRGSW